MFIHFVRPVSHSARLARRLAQLAFFGTLIALGTHRFGLIATPMLVAALAAATALAGLAVLLALIGLQRLWQVGAEGGIAALTALVLSTLPLGLAGGALYLARTTPAVAEVSTDRENPLQWLKVPPPDTSFLPKRDLSAAGQTAVKTAYPELTGRRYEGAMDRVYQAVIKVAKANHIRIVEQSGLENAIVDLEDSAPTGKDAASETEAPADAEPAATPEIGPVPRQRPNLDAPAAPRGDMVLQGETRSLVFGFTFDVVIRLREDAETTYVDMRVASRYGARDLGFSDGVAAAFLKALDAELLGIAGG